MSLAEHPACRQWPRPRHTPYRRRASLLDLRLLRDLRSPRTPCLPRTLPLPQTLCLLRYLRSPRTLCLPQTLPLPRPLQPSRRLRMFQFHACCVRCRLPPPSPALASRRRRTPHLPQPLYPSLPPYPPLPLHPPRRRRPPAPQRALAARARRRDPGNLRPFSATRSAPVASSSMTPRGLCVALENAAGGPDSNALREARIIEVVQRQPCRDVTVVCGQPWNWPRVNARSSVPRWRWRWSPRIFAPPSQQFAARRPTQQPERAGRSPPARPRSGSAVFLLSDALDQVELGLKPVHVLLFVLEISANTCG